ncbi:TPA: hypothetical protein ACGO2R_002201, partial [Streptococcus suis]
YFYYFLLFHDYREIIYEIFDENYSQEIPTRIKCLRKKYNLKQSDLRLYQRLQTFKRNLLDVFFGLKQGYD